MERISAQKQDKIVAILREYLSLSDNATIKREPEIESNLRYVPDIIIEDAGRLFVAELKDTARFETLSVLFLYRKVLADDFNKKDVTAVLMARRFTPQIEAIARENDVITITLPPDVRMYDRSPVSLESRKQKSRITSEKSWKVISSLLKNKFSSIRQIAQNEKVSYGLAHLVIKNLQEQGVVGRKSGYYEIIDMRKLLNGIAWERPFESLKLAEIDTGFDTSFQAAKTISKELKGRNKTFAFTSYTAGSLYTGYAVRHDIAYLYVKNKADIEMIQSYYGDVRGSKVKLVLYAPDRDVFSDIRELESVAIVSPSQALLDLAGLGYSGVDMTNAMVENYARL